MTHFIDHNFISQHFCAVFVYNAKNKKRAGLNIREYPNEFNEAPNEKLFCFLCSTNVAFEKKSFCGAASSNCSASAICCSIFSAKKVTYYLYLFVLFIGLFRRQQFLHTQDNFSEDLVAMFLSANNRLYKLRQDSVKELFQNFEHNVPSETTCRKVVNDLADKNFDSIN